MSKREVVARVLLWFLKALKLVPYALIIYGGLLIFAAGFTYAYIDYSTASRLGIDTFVLFGWIVEGFCRILMGSSLLIIIWATKRAKGVIS